MKPRSVGVVIALLFVVYAQHALAQATPPSSDKDDPIVTIDGAKNPEQIPEWAAWMAAFRFMAQPAKPFVPIPTNIHVVTTEAQRALIRKEALQVIARETEHGERGGKLRDGLTSDNFADRSRQADELEMQVRQGALDARDRLFAALPEEAQLALSAFAEDVKKGITITLRQSRVNAYRLPH